MVLERHERRKKEVSYKILAGTSAKGDSKSSDSGTGICCVCGCLRKEVVCVSSEKKDTSVLSKLINLLGSENDAFNEMDFICARCRTLVLNVARLKEELDKAKEKLQQIFDVNKSTIIYVENAIFDVVDDEEKSPTPFSSSVYDTQPLIIKLTKKEFAKLSPIAQSGGKVASKWLNSFRGRFILSNDDELVVETSGSRRYSDRQLSEEELISGTDDITDVLICGHCQKGFHSEDAIRTHLKAQCQTTESAFDCPHCPVTFAEEISLRKHLSMSHGNLQQHVRLFKCDVCDKTFTRKASLAEHIARHKGVRDRECKICQKKFYSTSFWRHMSTVHAQKEKLVHACSKCDRKFAQKYRLVLHEKSHVAYQEREYVCEKCPEEKRFATKNRFRTHEKQVHEADDQRGKSGAKLCPQCGMIFSSASAFNAHKKRQHFLDSDNAGGDGGEECTLCFEKFASMEVMQKHVRDVHESRSSTMHECSWCGRQFTTFNDLDAHTSTCQNATVMPNAETVGHEEIVQPEFDATTLLQEAGHSQSLLGADDPQSGTLIISTAAATNAEDSSTSLMLLSADAASSLLIPGYEIPPFENQLVDSATAASFGPAVVAVSNAEQPLTVGGQSREETLQYCTECGKTFPTYKAKSQHERLVHAKGPGYSCNFCHREFANSQYLRDHLRIHSQSKPYACDYEGCGKAFRLGKDLVRHKRVHTGEKPFKCEVCGKCFSASSNLSEHRTLHTGAMPYECSHCKKHFRLWSTMRKHSTRCKKSVSNGSNQLVSSSAVLVFDLAK